jgi:hypothetical protein
MAAKAAPDTDRLTAFLGRFRRRPRRHDGGGRRGDRPPAQPLGSLRAESQITDAFRTGAGMGWHEQHDDVPVGCEMFFRPGYLAKLVPSWIPALDGVAAKLNTGAAVADVGCGLGLGTSVKLARKRAAEAGVDDRTTFEVATAQDFAWSGYDLVTTFDCGSAGPRRRRSTSCSKPVPDSIRACVTDPAGCRVWRCRARHPARPSTPSRWSRSTSCE